MWGIFKGKKSNTPEDKIIMEDNEKIIRELKIKFQQKIKTLTKNIGDSESFFLKYSQVTPKEEGLTCTFKDMISTLEGLVGIIEQLRKQVQTSHQQLNELEKVRHMISHHHTIVSNIQQTNNEEIRMIYKQKQELQQSLNTQLRQRDGHIQRMEDQKLQLQQEISKFQTQLATLSDINHQLRAQNLVLMKKIQELQLKTSLFLVKGSENSKRVIDLDSIKLEYIFYYHKLKEGILQFVNIKQMHELKSVNKFFRYIVQKEEPRLISHALRRQFQKKQLSEIVNLKYYQKVLELFAVENIKLNALKYLYFKIKPASYIIPYLQQEQEAVQSKDETQIKDNKAKFNWRNLFSAEKQKKEESKFSLAQLKNEEEYKKIQHKIQQTFKNILSIKLPSDLTYFSQTMERQLLQLKNNLANIKSSKTSQGWAAELHCLSRFMYLEIGQIYNLLHVIFGELVMKTRDLVTVRESNEELRQNEKVLRNLIENISRDKSNLEHRTVVIQNDLLKRKLEGETLINSYEQCQIQLNQLKLKCFSIGEQNNGMRKALQKYHQQRRNNEQIINKIRQQMQSLEEMPNKLRKYSGTSMFETQE